MFLASLPWYDLKEVRSATDQLWRSLAESLRARGLARVPDGLTREMSYEAQWTSGRLLFSQACGYDVVLSFPNALRIVAAPIYSAVGCRGSDYSSWIVVREDSPAQSLEHLRGLRAAVNTPSSHSGMNALRAMVAPLHFKGRFFSSVAISGSHENSLRMVAAGDADVAAIDCVLYALLERHRPRELQNTRILCRGFHMPAPPFVAGSGLSDQDVRAIREALQETLELPALRGDRETLLLQGVEPLPLKAYHPIAELERNAIKCGYSEILAPQCSPASNFTGDRNPRSKRPLYEAPSPGSSQEDIDDLSP